MFVMKAAAMTSIIIGPWCVGCYIWYSNEETRQNIHFTVPSRASVSVVNPVRFFCCGHLCADLRVNVKVNSPLCGITDYSETTET